MSQRSKRPGFLGKDHDDIPNVAPWKCRAREAGTFAGNWPQDCDWPHCGCDKHAEKVLHSLDEQGLTLTDERQLKQLRRDAARYEFWRWFAPRLMLGALGGIDSPEPLTIEQERQLLDKMTDDFISPTSDVTGYKDRLHRIDSERCPRQCGKSWCDEGTDCKRVRADALKPTP